ncbi:hypothetical protein JWE21_29100, partial [Klebsiella pneumoniae]|nr:hypothetical protein [Klebsiella pneumoniae]
IFTLAAVAALLSSGWNNRQLLQRVSVDIARYERIAMDDYRPKSRVCFVPPLATVPPAASLIPKRCRWMG